MIISHNDSIIDNSGNIIDRTENRVIPTFVIIGDSNADGRGAIGWTGNKYFPEKITNIINTPQSNVKIFDYKATNRFIELSRINSQSPSGNFGFEVSIGYGLSKHYAGQEIRIIKYGLSSTTAGTGSAPANSWQPSANQMNIFEGHYANALAAAANEGVTLNIIACIAFLGTNDADQLTLANNYEANMTNVVNHLRTNVFEREVPFIITSCTDGTTYKTTVRAAQISLCANLTGCTYYNLHRWGVGSVHPLIAGIYGGGFDIARTIITGILSGVDYLEDYIFSFQTNASGAYSIALAINEQIFTGFYIDWGNGTQSEITTRSGTYNTTFADTSVKTIKVLILVPWNLFSMSINSGGSKIYGTFDISKLTGMDQLDISKDNTDFSTLLYPANNYSYKTGIGVNFFDNNKLTSIDFTNLYAPGSINIKNNTELLTVVDNSAEKNHVISMDIFNNAKLTTINIECWKWNTTASYYIRTNIKLTMLKLPKFNLGIGTWVWCYGNTILTEIINYEYSIYTKNYDFSNADLTRSQVDNLINLMWEKVRAVSNYRAQTSKTIVLNGNNGYTGTYDGTTDWSGGLPTSPGAKAYDMKNNITGTYNFATITI